MDYTALATTLNAMSLEQLRELNRLVINQINHLHRQREARSLMRFKIGDLVEFTSDKHACKIRATVTRINQKTLSVQELAGLKTEWLVPPSQCRLLGA